jgi:hypothetical protein
MINLPMGKTRRGSSGRKKRERAYMKALAILFKRASPRENGNVAYVDVLGLILDLALWRTKDFPRWIRAQEILIYKEHVINGPPSVREVTFRDDDMPYVNRWTSIHSVDGHGFPLEERPRDFGDILVMWQRVGAIQLYLQSGYRTPEGHARHWLDAYWSREWWDYYCAVRWVVNMELRMTDYEQHRLREWVKENLPFPRFRTSLMRLPQNVSEPGARNSKIVVPFLLH